MKICIVGCGLIGEKRAKAAKKLGCDEFVFVDLNLSLAKKLAQNFNGGAFSEFQQALDKNLDIDAVIVATSHHALSDIGVISLQNGIPTLIEKPGAVSLDEIYRIKDANNKNVPVSVGFNHRFHPSLLLINDWVSQGKLGELMYVRARYGHGGRIGYGSEWRCQREVSGGGQLIDQGAHLIDLALWYMGPLALEYAYIPNLYWSESDVEDNCFVALKGSQKRFAWLHATWSEWKNTFSFEISGKDVKMEVSGLGGSYGTETLKIYEMLPEMGPPKTTIYEYPFVDSSWELELDNFFGAIYRNEKIVGDLDDCIKMHEIVHSAYQQNQK